MAMLVPGVWMLISILVQTSNSSGFMLTPFRRCSAMPKILMPLYPYQTFARKVSIIFIIFSSLLCFISLRYIVNISFFKKEMLTSDSVASRGNLLLTMRVQCANMHRACVPDCEQIKGRQGSLRMLEKTSLHQVWPKFKTQLLIYPRYPTPI